MRILLVVHGLPPAAMGGTELYVDGIARRLAAAGDEVTVLCREARAELPELSVRWEERPGYRAALLNNTFRAYWSFEGSYRSRAPARAVAPVIDQVRPEVVHVHHLTTLSTEIVLELHRRGIPTVMTAHDYWTICHRGQLLDRRLERCDGPAPEPCRHCIGPEGGLSPLAFATARGAQRLAAALPRALEGAVVGRARAQLEQSDADTSAASALRLAHMREMASCLDLMLALSDTARQRLEILGMPEGRLRRTTIGLDTSRFRRRLRARRPGALRAGFVGSLIVSKAPHLLLEAVAGLPEGRIEVEVHGDVAAYHLDDGYRQRISPLLHVPGVTFAGPSPHDRIPGILDALDVLVVPSTWIECSPLVIKEAFAAGLPVVASDLGAMAEMVEHERSGLLFAPGDAMSLRAALERLASEPGLLERLSSGGTPPRDLDEDAREAHELYASLRATPRPRAPAERARVAAVIVNYRTCGDTIVAARSVMASRRAVDELTIVDNGSSDGSVARLRDELPGALLYDTGGNRGFAGGVNAGLRAAYERGADLFLVVNSDCFVPPGVLGALERALAEDPAAGIAGPLIVSRAFPGKVASAGISVDARTGRLRHRRFGDDAAAIAPAVTLQDAVSGSAMLVTRRLVEAVGLLEESYFHSFEEIELCIRARARGFHVLLATGVRVLHAGGLSLEKADDAIYYATRNHLILHARNFPPSRSRQAAIVGFNLLHAALTAGTRRGPALRAFADGVLDYARGRAGARS